MYELDPRREQDLEQSWANKLGGHSETLLECGMEHQLEPRREQDLELSWATKLGSHSERLLGSRMD